MPDNVTVDAFSSTGNGVMASGSVASRLLQANFNVNALRTNGVLRKDEWIAFDTALVTIARERLRAAADLVAAGLVFNLSNAMGTTRLEWEQSSDMTDAEWSMSGVKEGERDRIEYALASMPIPIVHKDFSLNIRALSASRNSGQPLDTTQVQIAGRKVAEAIEGSIFNGLTIAGTNGTIYGYRTAPNRNTGSVTADWATASGAQIVGDVLEMIGLSIADNMFGPWVIYLPYDAHVNMMNDFKADSDKTIMQRVMEIEGISSVRATSYMTAGEVVMVQMTSDVVELVIGQQPVPIEWDSKGGMVFNWKVMAIMVPRLKSDFNGASGITHYS